MIAIINHGLGNFRSVYSAVESLNHKAVVTDDKSEIKKWPHPRSTKGVISLAKWRGATVGYKSAEAFVLGRHYE